MKECFNCRNTEKDCPDFYKTGKHHDGKDICGDCYGMME